MRIALDLDGTLADQHSVVLPWLSAVKNIPITVEQIDSYLALTKYGLNGEEVWAYYRDYWAKFPVEAIQPIDRNACYWVDELRKEHKVDIVTNHDHDNNNLQGIQKWLLRWCIDYDSLILCKPKADKAELDYDIFIDDSPYLAEKIGKYPKKLLLQFSQPWNKYKGTGNVRTILTLKEAPNVIRNWENGEWKR